MLTLGSILGLFWLKNYLFTFIVWFKYMYLQSLTHKLNTHLAYKANGYWCWAFPEDTLDHWHSYEGGFRSRVPADQRPGVRA